MIIDDVKVVYTKEDENGFYFKPMREEIYQKNIKVYKLKRRSYFLWMISILLIGEFLRNFVLPKNIGDFIALNHMLVIFICGLYIWENTSNIRLMRKHKSVEFEVEIIEKKEIEEIVSSSVDNISNHVKLYPVLAKDTTTDYESILFVPKEVYETHGIGEIVILERFRNK